MPYIEGDTLRDRLDREQQLPVDEAVHITKAIASALDYAHRHGVIHRDIKPANILMHDGQPLVADFGIAFVHVAGRAARYDLVWILNWPEMLREMSGHGKRGPNLEVLRIWS